MTMVSVSVVVDVDDVLDGLGRAEQLALARRVIAEEASDESRDPAPLDDERTCRELWEAVRSGDRYAFNFILQRWS